MFFTHWRLFLLTVNNSNIKLKSSGDDGELTAGAMSAGKDYRRLLSETKRLLLMSPTYSLTLAQILEHFVANGDSICTSTTELHHALTSTQNSFMVQTQVYVSVIGFDNICVWIHLSMVNMLEHCLLNVFQLGLEIHCWANTQMSTLLGVHE